MNRRKSQIVKLMKSTQRELTNTLKQSIIIYIVVIHRETKTCNKITN